MEKRLREGKKVPLFIHAPYFVDTNSRMPGDTAKIGFGEYHHIQKVAPGGAWTLFISGPYKGTWGFLVDGVKKPWREYFAHGKASLIDPKKADE